MKGLADMGRHSEPERPASFRDFSSVRVACDGLGRSALVGALAVPSGWPMTDPPSEPPVEAGHAHAESARWLTFQDGLMGAITGRATTKDDADV